MGNESCCWDICVFLIDLSDIIFGNNVLYVFFDYCMWVVIMVL